MTYGDKYCALTERFIEIQDEFIAATCDGKAAGNLSSLMVELKIVQQELKDLQAFMKMSNLTLIDEYPLETVFQYHIPELQKAG